MVQLSKEQRVFIVLHCMKTGNTTPMALLHCTESHGHDNNLKCLSPNFFYLINEKYSLQKVELSKHIFV